MTQSSLKEQIAREFGTPAVVVDLDVVERNLARVQKLCDTAGLTNRPHIKTHKSTMLARLQQNAGAVGITCQKLGEAEIMGVAGIEDILISYNLLGDEKIGRLGRLLSQTKVAVSCDNEVVLHGLPRAAEIAGRDLSVLVECDTGRNRTGVTSIGELLTLASKIKNTDGLQFGGLLLYPPDDSHEATSTFLPEAVEALRTIGLTPTIVSGGGTPNLRSLDAIKGFTEHRPGTYIFNDKMTVASGSASLGDCAVTVYSTVVSRAEPHRGVLDAGSKLLTPDTGGLADGYGLILDYPNIKIPRLMEEHGFLQVPEGNSPSIGEVVRIVPNHVCVVVNMVDSLVTVRNGVVTGTIKVDARGCVR